MATASISEIFSTIQGEGPYTGERQLFVRLAGCPLRCDYCDTPDSLVANGHQKMTVPDVMERVRKICRNESIQTVSVTGGEPLAHLPFLKEFIPSIKKNRLRVYLETAGVHPKALAEVVKDCDVVSMDIKLPSATGKSFWKEHEDFLKEGQGKIFAKVVIENHTSMEELEKAFQILSQIKPAPLLVLQPVTPQAGIDKQPSRSQLEKILGRAREFLPEVRLMPQQHKIWGIR